MVIGEKGRAQLVRDSRESIAMTINETQKLPINFTQVRPSLCRGPLEKRSSWRLGG